MSKETNIKVIDTTPPRTGEENNLPAFVKVATYHPHNREETKLILQRYLLTKIETIINRDEALAVARALALHFDLTTDELNGMPSTRIDIVHGPKGCGKTKRTNLLAHHLNDAVALEMDEFGKLDQALRLKGKVLGILMLTNATGSELLHRAQVVRENGFQVKVHAFSDVMADIQLACKHNWQRRCCADIHQPDYYQCRDCDLTKEM